MVRGWCKIKPYDWTHDGPSLMRHDFTFPTLGPQGRAKFKLVTPSTTVLNLVLGRPYWRYFHGQHDFGDESRSIAGDRRWRKIFHLKKSKTKINQTESCGKMPIVKWQRAKNNCAICLCIYAFVYAEKIKSARSPWLNYCFTDAFNYLIIQSSVHSIFNLYYNEFIQSTTFWTWQHSYSFFHS